MKRAADTARPIRRKMKAPMKADELLASALKGLGLDEKIARYRFVTHWREIVGPEIASRTRPECLRNGALVVRVTSSAWAQELSFQKGTILKRLAKFLDAKDLVEDINFYVGEIR